MKFNLTEAIKTANQVVFNQANRNLTDVEVLVLKGAWYRQEYDQIAAQNQYTTSYISRDVAPKLWILLTEDLGEKVKKSNFKEALKRRWEEFNQEPIARKSCSIADQLPPSHLKLLKPEQPSPYPTNREPETSRTNLYVERLPVESICYKTLLQPGALIRLKAPRLMGKTSVITRVLARLDNLGYRTVRLSLELADRRTHLTNLNKFLRWLCLNLSRELGLPSQLDEYWDESGIGSKVSCTTYLEEYLLAQADSPLVLCLDDVDLLFPYAEIYEDFFGLLRSWYEKTRSRQCWKKLRLALVHATDVYIRLQINQSPFNVGFPIELPEFTDEEVRSLAQQYGLEVDKAKVKTLMNLVGGHPFLLSQAFAHLKNHLDITFDQLLADATKEAGIYGSHLRSIWLNLQEHPQLAAAFKKVVTSTSWVQLEPMSVYQLQNLGLVKLSGNQVTPRCHLYRQYFCERLGNI